MYSDYAGDVSLALDPHPPPDTPSTTDTLELSVTEPSIQEVLPPQQQDTPPANRELSLTEPSIQKVPPPQQKDMPPVDRQHSALRDVTNVTNISLPRITKPLISRDNATGM